MRGIRTAGTIVEVVRDASGEGGDTFKPVVAFTTKQGTQIVAESFYGTAEAGSYFRIGQQVDILYSARNPRFSLSRDTTFQPCSSWVYWRPGFSECSIITASNSSIPPKLNT
ncbi:DUF3592 domain-containing protein [Hymenobacter terricola]